MRYPNKITRFRAEEYTRQRMMNIHVHNNIKIGNYHPKVPIKNPGDQNARHQGVTELVGQPVPLLTLPVNSELF